MTGSLSDAMRDSLIDYIVIDESDEFREGIWAEFESIFGRV